MNVTHNENTLSSACFGICNRNVIGPFCREGGYDSETDINQSQFIPVLNISI